MRKVSFRNSVVVAVLTAALGACTLEPHYQRPALSVQQTWPDGTPVAAAGAASGRTSDIGWRDFFSDPALQRLIEVSLSNNRDARIAVINVAAARAQYRIQRSDLFPSINVTGSQSVSRIPGNVISSSTGGSDTDGGNGAGGGITGFGGAGGIITRDYNLGIGITSYEIDLFGRIRSLDKQALEQYYGYVETQRSTQISLIAEVANAWITILSDRALLRVTQDTLKSQRESYELTRKALEGGTENGLTLRQAETSVDTAEVNLSVYGRQLAQDRNALVLLLGAPVPEELPSGADIDSEDLIEDLPAGLPSEVLTRRPDVLSAEHNLIGANANIGAARAAFFPSITLTGNYGTSSSQFSGLFKGGSQTWSFRPQLNLPIFAGGANLANLDLSHTQKNVDIAQYEKTVQTAFREVSDGLVAASTLRDQLRSQQKLQDATQDAYHLSQLRFDNGIDNYLNVLDSQRSLYSAQQSLINAKLARLQNLVTLYKVLGGGLVEKTATTGNAVAHADAAR